MQSIFARGVYLGENSSQSASVEFVRPWRTNYARGRLQAFCPKRASPFLDSLPPAQPCGKQSRAGICAKPGQSRQKTWISKLMVTSSAVSAARRSAPDRGVFQ